MNIDLAERLYISDGHTPEQAKMAAKAYLDQLNHRLRESVSPIPGVSAASPPGSEVVSQKAVLTTYNIITKRGSFHYQARDLAEIEAWANDYVAGFMRAEAIADPSPMSRESARAQRRAQDQTLLRETYRKFIAEGRHLINGL